MADGVTGKMTGVEETISNFKKIAIASPTAVMRGTLRTSAKVERQAKLNTPVDTGRLRASISQNWTGSGKARGDVDSKAGADDGIGQPPAKPDAFTAVIGTNVEYGPAVEFNEIAHHEVGGPHFLYGAYFSHEGDLEDDISLELGKELAKAMKK
jgi:hypothetical protein